MKTTPCRDGSSRTRLCTHMTNAGLSFFQIQMVIVLFLASAFQANLNAQTVSPSLWNEFTSNPDNHNHIPRVTDAGYRRGEVPLPNLPVVANLVDFGGVGDGVTDNTLAFKEAIDAAFRVGGGAVSIPSGTFVVSGMILMHRDGVVLRGAGKANTTIRFTNPLLNVLGSTGTGSQHWNWTGGLIWVGPKDLHFWNASSAWSQNRTAEPDFSVNASNWEPWRKGATLTNVTSTGNRGVRTVTVANAANLKPGMLVLMTWENPADDSLWKEIAQHSSFQGYDFGVWLGATPYFSWPVEIASISGNQVTLAQPVRVSIQSAYSVKIREIGQHVRESGIESLTISMANTRTEYSYNNGDGWNGVFFNRSYNCWIRNVDILNGENAIHVSSSKNITVTDIEVNNTVRGKYLFTSRVMSHDLLFSDFEAYNTNYHTNGINTEYLSSGNVWTQAYLGTGTFDSHRLMPFDYVRTEILMRNDANSRPGGDGKAGPFTGRRAVHWNVEVANSNRPAETRGQWVYHPIQYTFGAQVGIKGAAVYTQDDSNPWGMPGGDKNVISGDIGVTTNPVNLYLAQLDWRKNNQSWAQLASPHNGIVSPTNPVLRATASVRSGRTISQVSFEIDGQVEGSVTSAPYQWTWSGATPGKYAVRVRMTDNTGAVVWSIPQTVVVGEWKRFSHNHPRLNYMGIWSTLTAPGYNEGKARMNNTGSAVEITFRGVRARWITMQNNNGQNVTVTLNGSVVAQPVVHGGQVQHEFVGWDSGELPNGVHTLRLQGSTRLLVDYLEILTTEGNIYPEPLPAGAITHSALFPIQGEIMTPYVDGFSVEKADSPNVIIGAVGNLPQSYSLGTVGNSVALSFTVVGGPNNTKQTLRFGLFGGSAVSQGGQRSTTDNWQGFFHAVGQRSDNVGLAWGAYQQGAGSSGVMALGVGSASSSLADWGGGIVGHYTNAGMRAPVNQAVVTPVSMTLTRTSSTNVEMKTVYTTPRTDGSSAGMVVSNGVATVTHNFTVPSNFNLTISRLAIGCTSEINVKNLRISAEGGIVEPPPPVAVTGVSLSPTSLSLQTGATGQLTATVAPSNATNKNVSWSSNNTSVATVSSSGLVTGVAAGNATITVSTQDGGFTATTAVTVTVPSAGPTITMDSESSSGIAITGSWNTSTSISGYLGSNYLHDNNIAKGSKSVKFTPTISEAGMYEVAVMYTSASNRASNVPIIIVHNGETTQVTVDQRTGGGDWVVLGSYYFATGTGNSVTVSNAGTNGYVIVDAVRFISTGPGVDEWMSTDIGSPALAGSAVMESDNSFTITGAGVDIWGNSDSFHYAYLPITGDAEIVARVVSLTNTNAWAKAGVMIRESLDANSKHASMVATPGSGASFQRRVTTGGSSAHTTHSGHTAPIWVSIVREGDTFSAYRSSNGDDWILVGSAVIPMAQTVYIGLAVTSHNTGALTTAVIDDVWIW